MSARDLVMRWLEQFTRGRPSDSVVTIPVSELIDLEEKLRDSPRGKVSRSRKPKGMTSRSKQRKRPNTPYRAMVREHVCCACYDPRCTPVEGHHAGRKRDKGFGQKAPDDRLVPLGLPCHRYFHDTGHFRGMTVEETRLRIGDTIIMLQAKWAERNNQGEEF